MHVYAYICRSANFSHVNGLLRDQLDQATVANQALTADLHKLLRLKEEYELKEADWRKEEQVRDFRSIDRSIGTRKKLHIFMSREY
jgi:hypothetical protein